MTREEVTAAWARLEAIRAEHSQVGEKFMAYAAPRQKMCADHLKRTEFPPYLEIQRAQEKVNKRQAALVSETRSLEQQLLTHTRGEVTDELSLEPSEVLPESEIAETGEFDL